MLIMPTALPHRMLFKYILFHLLNYIIINWGSCFSVILTSVDRPLSMSTIVEGRFGTHFVETLNTAIALFKFMWPTEILPLVVF